MSVGDTIAAIATAPGRGGIAVIRVSGPDAFAIAERLAGRRPEPGRILFATFRARGGAGDTVLDSGVLLSFRSPHSYTGEDVVEFQCHGGAITPRRILEACFAAGARLAHRGEFTERAFLNGRLDYAAAESVIDLIDAKTERAADAALAGLDGAVRTTMRRLYAEAIELSATVEHALDVDESELPPSFHDEVRGGFAALKDDLGKEIARAKSGRILRDGALVVLTGAPNAGKSSLMNALLGENRAIVSDVPGTTRDAIEEWLDIDGWPLRLVDTAGIRDWGLGNGDSGFGIGDSGLGSRDSGAGNGDEIEREGIRRAQELIAKADLVLTLVPATTLSAASGRQPAVSSHLPPTTYHLPSTIYQLPTTIYHLPSTNCHLPPANVPQILVSSKCDLARGPYLNVSVKTGEGLDALKRELAAAVEKLAATRPEAAGDPRLSAMVEALRLLGEETADLVLLGNALHAAAERLGAALGAVYSSDLLDALFSRFCVGK